jgi:hypothetical protein
VQSAIRIGHGLSVVKTSTISPAMRSLVSFREHGVRRSKCERRSHDREQRRTRRLLACDEPVRYGDRKPERGVDREQSDERLHPSASIAGRRPRMGGNAVKLNSGGGEEVIHSRL